MNQHCLHIGGGGAGCSSSGRVAQRAAPQPSFRASMLGSRQGALQRLKNSSVTAVGSRTCWSCGVRPRASSSSGTHLNSRLHALAGEQSPLQLPTGSPPQQQAKTQSGKVGVLLLNLGGPETMEDVKPFLYNLFADPDILRLPPWATFLQPVLATIISTLRTPKSSEGYEAIGGGSPLRKITDDQASALARSLRMKGVDTDVYVAMRYWHPYTEEAMEQIKADGVSRLVILPLYPQFSVSTSGSSLRLLEQMFKTDPVLSELKHTVIPSWYQRPGYVRAMVDLMTSELMKFSDPSKVELFFSAHGVPLSYIEQAGDPYKEEMEECVALIMKEVESRGFRNHHTLAYQSRVGPVEWLKPYTDDKIRTLASEGVTDLLAIPISFVSEHIETLEEIDMEYRDLALSCGITNWGRVPALNTDAAFIDDLADAVIEALPYVGCVAGAAASDSLVPMGELEVLLDAYDRDRLALPPPVSVWEWGWTKSAETWNGRIAMIAIILILLLEITTGQSILTAWLAPS